MIGRGLRSALGLSAQTSVVLARTSLGFAALGVKASSYVAHEALQAPLALVRKVVPAAGGVERQVWAAEGRAQIEVHTFRAPDALVLAEAVTKAVDALDGVQWVGFDAVTRRLVVRFDADALEVADLVTAVDAAEQAIGTGHRPSSRDEPSFPGDSAPVRTEAFALAAEAAGLSVAAVGRVARLPSLPRGAAAAVVAVDYQPRLRRVLERRLGQSGADLALAVSTAVVHGLSQGVPSLVVDTAQRTQSLVAARAIRSTFGAREDELCGPGRPLPAEPVDAGDRPVPVPGGPVERLSDRAASGSLAAAGMMWAASGSPRGAGQAVLIGAPKAARAAREAFADTLAAGLASRGSIVVDRRALRRLDRVSAVLVDSAVLLDSRPLILQASATAEGWTSEHVWSASQRLLWDEQQLPVPPPPGRFRHRLGLSGDRHPEPGRVSLMTLTEDGEVVGELQVGRELDHCTDAVLRAAQDAGLRLLVSADPSLSEIAGRADQIVALGEGSPALAEHVRRLQADGEVVAVVSSAEEALAAADVGIGLVPSEGRVPWAADVICGPGLSEVPRLLGAVSAARAASHRGATLAVGASFIGGLMAAVGSGRRGGAVLPVNAAAASALIAGTVAARGVVAQPAPEPVLHTPWHALEPDEVLGRLPRRRAELPPEPEAGTVPGAVGAALAVAGVPVAGLARLVSNVRAELADPLTPVLATGAAASAVIGSPTDAVLVGGVLAANAVISGAQRLRADQALRALLLDQRLPARLVEMPEDPAAHPAAALSKGLTEARAAASADGGAASGAGGPATSADGTTLRVIPAERLVPGDLIDLQPGDVVPADARLLSESGLEVDEASLTGESVAVPKQLSATPGAELADRACMVYEGTTVLAGSGRAVVVAVGGATEAGRAVALAGRSSAAAGMQARLEELTRRGLPVTLLGGAAVSALALLRRQPVRSAIASGVSVAVAAVPEGLPLVATVAQLSASRRLSQRGVLVRSTRTVEALGRVDTVCFDKTGTLTEGQLRLVRAAGIDAEWALEAPDAVRVLRAAAQACPAPGEGQPVPHATDRAVLEGTAAVLGEGAFADWEELTEVPFQSDRGFSAALGRTGNHLRLVVKGAPEVLLPRCTHLRDDSGKRRLTQSTRRRADERVRSLASQGLRVLAVARRAVDAGVPIDDDEASELAEDLTLLGFVALADVARPEAASTVAALQAVGLSTVMITGDHPVTAGAIATGLGIPADQVVTGSELVGLDDEARTRLVAGASVFARVSPEQKLRIIAALQKAGRVVAMTGDGANDAAAIRLADVGIGMAAHGSSSARSASDVVLTKPDVSLILDALVEGRAMWGRVRDAIAILLGGNAGEVAFTLAGTGIAGRAPIGTRQFLLVNMLTDLFPAMAIALAATPEDDESRQRLLQSGAPSLGAPLLRDIGIRGASTAAGALAAWQIGRVTGTRRRADTIALGALVGTQLGQTLLVGHGNPLVVATGVGSGLALAAIVQTPGVSQFFGCTPLGPVAWSTVVGCAAGATALGAVAPHLLRRLTGEAAEIGDLPEVPEVPEVPEILGIPEQGAP